MPSNSTQVPATFFQSRSCSDRYMCSLSRVCAVPFLPPDMATFHDAVGLAPDFKFESLEYENACDSSTVRSLITHAMGELSTIGFIAAPYGSLLRFAEGIDSMRNFAAVDMTNATDSQRASALICGMTQLGGVVWAAIMVIFIGAACVCMPVGSWCCLSCYRGCIRRSRRERERTAALDRLVEEQQSAGQPKEPLLDSRPKGSQSEETPFLLP